MTASRKLIQYKHYVPYLILALFVILGGVALIITMTNSNVSSEFVGSKECASCHEQQFNNWKKSDHFKSMAEADSNFVSGNFDNVKVTFHNVQSHFFKRDEKYWVTTANDKGEQETFRIRYTFGHWPLQQYLIETVDGHIQAFNIAWDNRSKEQGGQKWFHLRTEEKINPQHTFYWTRHFQNWNSRCADCHSTNLTKNYDPVKYTYNTQWSEINVACEACHGSGSKHVTLVNKNKYSKINSGFSKRSSQALSWKFKEGESIAQPQGEKNTDHINMCGSCHALRTQLKEKSLGENFHDSSRLRLINQASYFADGQIREEVFVLGSFLQSKMHAKGVTCNNCHNPHSGKVLIKGNSLCSQCHKPEVYDTSAHHHHSESSTGAACVNCHMPNRTYMQVDERRDHSFTIPRPELSLELGIPNACTSCHKNEKKKDNEWASKTLLEWGIEADKNHWSKLNFRTQLADILVTRPLTQAVMEPDLPDIVRASLLQQLSSMPSRVSTETAQQLLQNKNPLLRRAAVSVLQGMPAEVRWKLLSPHMDDSSLSVRYQIAVTLSDVLNQLPADQQHDLISLIDEYRNSLAVSADSPATQLSIATLEIRLGNLNKAEQAYLHALRIEPNYVPALINLADFYRGTGQEEKSEPLFKKALRLSPDSGAAYHSYGLFLVRKQNYDGALPYLKAAVGKNDALPRYAYVYAVALDSIGRADDAVKILIKANERWPNQYNLLMTLIIYLEKTGNTNSVYKYLSRLTAIAPNAADVKKLLKKYNN